MVDEGSGRSDGIMARVPLSVEELAQIRVGILGAGSLGSRVATELGRSGIRRFALFDKDHLEAPNLSRHVGSLKDLERPKVEVIRDVLHGIDPTIEVGCHKEDVETVQDLSTEPNLSLIVEATGTHKAGHLVSRISSDWGIPAVFGGVYDKGIGGFSLAYRPNSKDACFSCVMHALHPKLREAGLAPAGRPYGEPALEPLRAVSSLSLSVWYVALLVTRMGLGLVLTPEQLKRAALSPLPGQFILWGNTAMTDWFEAPLMYRAVKTVELKRQDCPSCSAGAVDAA